MEREYTREYKLSVTIQHVSIGHSCSAAAMALFVCAPWRKQKERVLNLWNHRPIELDLSAVHHR